MEQEFFEAFGIKPTLVKEHYTTECTTKNNKNKFACDCKFYSCGFGEEICSNPKKYDFEQYPRPGKYIKDCCPENIEFETIQEYEVYPPITPKIVLKLIKILLKSSNEFHISISKNEFGCNQGYIGGYYEQTFEESILSLCIEAKDEIQDQVRALFND